MVAADEVIAWHWRLDDEVLARRLPEASALSAAERAKAARFRADEHRRRYVRAHLGLRALLAGEAGAAPEALRFDTTCRLCGDAEHGKPRLVAPPRAADDGLDFSLSHAGEVALLAVACGRAVGADVEALPPGMDWREAGALFNDAERATIEAVEPADQGRVFLVLWTRKEALLKTWGHGVVEAARAVDVSPPGAAREGALKGAGPGGEDWSFRGLDPSPGHVATVGAEGPGWVLRAGPWAPGLR